MALTLEGRVTAVLRKTLFCVHIGTSCVQTRGLISRGQRGRGGTENVYWVHPRWVGTLLAFGSLAALPAQNAWPCDIHQISDIHQKPPLHTSPSAAAGDSGGTQLQEHTRWSISSWSLYHRVWFAFFHNPAAFTSRQSHKSLSFIFTSLKLELEIQKSCICFPEKTNKLRTVSWCQSALWSFKAWGIHQPGPIKARILTTVPHLIITQYCKIYI